MAGGRVVGKGCDVRAAGRVADYKNRVRVAAELIDVVPDPRDAASEVVGTTRVGRLGRQAKFDVDADIALTDRKSVV